MANDDIAFGASAKQMNDIERTSDELMERFRANFVAEDGIVVRAVRTRPLADAHDRAMRVT